MSLVHLLLSFLFLFPVFIAQTCDNPMLKTTANPNGIIPAESNPVKVTGLQFCKFLNDQTSCCSVETIGQISKTLNATRDLLMSQMKAMDQNISESRISINAMAKNIRETAKIMKDLNKTQQDIAKKAKKTRILQSFDILAGAMENVAKAGEGLPGLDEFAKRSKSFGPSSPNDDPADVMNKQADGLINMTKTQFPIFQKSRKQCVDLLLKTYSKFYCLSCQSPSTLFVGQKMKLHSDLCKGLMSSCFDFLSLDELFSSLANVDFFKSQVELTTITKNFLQYMKGSMDQLSGILDQMNTDPTGAVKKLSEITTSMSSSSTAQALIDFGKNQLTKPKPKISRFPQNCLNSDSCTHICTKFINKKGIAIDSVVAQPGVDPADTVKRMLHALTNEDVEDQNHNRILAIFASSTDVDYDDSTGLKLDSITSGVEASVEVQEDPAAVASRVTAPETETPSSSNGLMIKVGMMVFIGFAIIA